MNIAGPKGVIIGESWAGRCASIVARDNVRRFNDVFRIVCTVEVLALVELTLAHVAGLALRVLLFIL